MKRSGFLLCLAGLISGLFFWVTDPGIGWGLKLFPSKNVIDAIHEARFPTLVGLAGSVFVLFVGLYLMTRKAA